MSGAGLSSIGVPSTVSRCDETRRAASCTESARTVACLYEHEVPFGGDCSGVSTAVGHLGVAL